MKIVVFGLGYVGLSNAILLASKHTVVGVDVSENIVASVNNRKSPIVDKEIEEYLATKKLYLSATTNPAEACENADFVIIATPTDYNPEINHLDTSSIENVYATVRSVNKKAYIVIKSTIPIGYTKSLISSTGDKRILFSPEFLREGKALWDNLYPSRIIVGADSSIQSSFDAANVFANTLKSCALKKDVEVLIINSTEAEASKLFANTYLALRVSFFNELDAFAETHNLDTKNIITAVSLDPRIGNHYNNPSFGYGGYCLPKDTKQLLASFHNIPSNIIPAIVEANKTRKMYISNKVMERAGYPHRTNITVGIFRLTMKSNSDNFRQSAIHGIIKNLSEKGANILIYEPMLPSKNTYMGYNVTCDIALFKETADVIIANRVDNELLDVSNKVYTRDVFQRD
jgi:UDPglucose 6-dehydrogenase